MELGSYQISQPKWSHFFEILNVFPGDLFFLNKIQTFPAFYQTLPFLLGIREENHQQKSSSFEFSMIFRPFPLRFGICYPLASTALGVESSWSCHADGRTSMPRWHWWLVILFSCWAADFNGSACPENPGRTPKPVEGWLMVVFPMKLQGFVHPRFSVFWSINSSFDPFLCCLHECLWLSRGKIKHIQDDVFFDLGMWCEFVSFRKKTWYSRYRYIILYGEWICQGH